MLANVQGMAVGLGLIAAIGAQNAFVLKQGLKGQHIFWICVCCAVSDSILIMAGVFGLGDVVQQHPQVLTVIKYLGIAFLFLYGSQHFYQAWCGQKSMQLADIEQPTLKALLLLCLALTWLNPHVYLDTVLLLGSISSQFGAGQLDFMWGAITASWLFFFALGYGAKWLLPLFQSPSAWQILDCIIALMMWSIAWSLLTLV